MTSRLLPKINSQKPLLMHSDQIKNNQSAQSHENKKKESSWRTFDTNSQDYKEVRAKIVSLRRFYYHLSTYIFITVVLIVINFMYTPSIIWFQWFAVTWGIFLAFHAMNVFIYGELLGKEWEERKIQEGLKKRSGEKSN